MKQLSNPSTEWGKEGGGRPAFATQFEDLLPTTPTGAGVTALLLLLTATKQAGGRSDAAALAAATLPQISAGKDSENYVGMSWISFFCWCLGRTRCVASSTQHSSTSEQELGKAWVTVGFPPCWAGDNQGPGVKGLKLGLCLGFLIGRVESLYLLRILEWFCKSLHEKISYKVLILFWSELEGNCPVAVSTVGPKLAH